MTKTTVTKRATLSERAWAEVVAGDLGLEKPADIDRVQGILAEAGVTAGRPPSMQHRLRVRGVYFAGVKVLRDRTDLDEDKGDGQGDDAAAVAEGADGAEADAHVVTEPFAFQHTFTDGFTAFATDNINDAGKSTILGVLLWALRGSAPTPTLQGDIRDSWLREAIVTLEIDGTTVLIQWRIDRGRPEGAIYTATCPVDLAPLRDAGLETATEEWQVGTGPDPTTTWPGLTLVNQLSADGDAKLLAPFEAASEFEQATGGALMPRLGLEPVKVWQKRPNAVDQHDATVGEHGWKTLASALAITEPTSGSVLGEEVFATQHLMGVFLGSTWSLPTVTARWQQRRADSIVAGARRRAADDQRVRQDNLDKLKDELAATEVELDALGDVPAYVDVLTATETVSNDAFAAAETQRTWLDAAAEYGQIGRDLERAQHDLYALVEAAATKKFWHSLRPSCCPRCDKVIDSGQWAREQQGHCSLCDGEFIEVTTVPDAAEAEPVEDAEVDVADDNEDNEDEIVAVRAQVTELEEQLETAETADGTAKAAYDHARATAAASAAVLEQFDKAAAAERRRLEDRIFVLNGRIEEREAIDAAAVDPEVAEQEFAVSVFKAAFGYAVKQRDTQQKQTLAVVSEVITDLGAKFGVRNLVSARLGANGHLPVVKGVKKDKFSDLAPGERLRLRIALIVGLLQAGEQAGTGRHPGLLIVDDLTTQEINRDNAAAMTRELVAVPGLQIITASTYAHTLAAAAGDAGDVVTPPAGSDVMF